MEYMPQLSPSSCSDETLIGTPDSPTKILLDGIDSLKIISMQEKNPFAVDINLDKEPTKHLKPPVRPQFRRRNAISNQSSNDDTIVCHGPSYGAVFGNVSGGAGNLTFESSYFASKTNKKQQSNNIPSSPSIAYYLSPTYGLPDNPFDSLLSPPIKEEEEATNAATADVPDDVRSAFSSDESSESEEKIPSSSRNHKTGKTSLIRSPATFSLSTLLDHAPSPPIRMNDKNASLSAPCCGFKLIKTNQKFFDAIQANIEEDKEYFKLILPGGEQVDQIPTFKQRKRQSSQRITLQQVALQAGHVASLRRQGLDMGSR